MERSYGVLLRMCKQEDLTSNKLHFYLIDFYKLFFSIVILIHHTYQLPSFNNEHVYLKSGALAVDFFFIVSGIFMMKHLSNKNYPDFNNIVLDNLKYTFINFKRIIPYVFLAYCFSLFLKICIDNTFNIYKIIASSIFELSFTFMFGIKGLYINSLTWFISALIISKFVIYPLVARMKYSYQFYIAPIISFLILGYLSQNYGAIGGTYSWGGFVYIGVLRAVMDLHMGIIVWSFVNYINSKNKHYNKCFIYFLKYMCLLMIMVYYQCCRQGQGDFFIYFLTILFIILLFLLTDSNHCSKFNKYFKEFLSKMGMLSLAIYVNQNVFLTFLKINKYHLNKELELIIYLCGTITLSFLTVYILSRYNVVIRRTK